MSLLISKTVYPPAYKKPYSLESGRLVQQIESWRAMIRYRAASYSMIPKVVAELDETDFHPECEAMNRLLDSIKR